MKRLILFILLITNPAAFAENPKKTSSEAEPIDIQQLTEKYWAEGKESELGVVQNRKYTTSKKLESALSFGTISSDPFLSVKSLVLSAGYHFNQYTSVHLIGWKNFIGASDALKTFESETGSTVNTNHPTAYYGAEIRQNFLYGKASLFGKAIIYVDLFVLAGMGMTVTESGSNFTPSLGLGQKIYLNQRMSLNLDYRIMTYGETILSKNPATRGIPVGERTNTSDAVMIGLGFYFF